MRPDSAGGAGLPAALVRRLTDVRDGWPAVVVVHDRPTVEALVEDLETIIAGLIDRGLIGWACDLGDIRDLFEDALDAAPLESLHGVQVSKP